MKVFYFNGSSIREKLCYIRLKILRFAVVAKKGIINYFPAYCLVLSVQHIAMQYFSVLGMIV